MFFLHPWAWQEDRNGAKLALASPLAASPRGDQIDAEPRDNIPRGTPVPYATWAHETAGIY